MNLLTLIEKGDVHLPKGKKILKAQEFSAVLEANELLEMTHKETLQYRKKVVEEIETSKAEAELAGFDVGMQHWNDALRSLENEIKKVRDEMEKSIVSLAMAAAKKIVGKEIASSKETVVDIVATALKPVTQHKRVTIYVNPQDLDVMEKERKRLKNLFEHLESLAIVAREDVTTGGCIIETESGIINAKLEKQWEALEEAFKTLVKGQKS